MNNRKARVEHVMDNLAITIPSKKNWLALILGTLWIASWSSGLKFVLSIFSEAGLTEADGSFGIFMLVWISAWVLGGLGVSLLLLWGYFGEERLEFSTQKLYFEKTVFGLGIKKELALAEVQNFRQERTQAGWFRSNRWSYWGLGPGNIKFDYGLKTFSFGLAVDDAEAKYLVGLFREKIGE